MYLFLNDFPSFLFQTLRFCKVWATKVFRGVRFPDEVLITAGYKPDWALVPKHEEEKYLNYDGPEREVRVIPKTQSYPPLLERILMKEGDLSEPPRMSITPKVSAWNTAVREDKINELDQIFPHGGVRLSDGPST